MRPQRAVPQTSRSRGLPPRALALPTGGTVAETVAAFHTYAQTVSVCTFILAIERHNTRPTSGKPRAPIRRLWRWWKGHHRYPPATRPRQRRATRNPCLVRKRRQLSGACNLWRRRFHLHLSLYLGEYPAAQLKWDWGSWTPLLQPLLGYSPGAVDALGERDVCSCGRRCADL